MAAFAKNWLPCVAILCGFTRQVFLYVTIDCFVGNFALLDG